MPVSPQKSLRSARHSPIRIVPYFVNEHIKLNQITENLIKNRVIKDVLDYFNSALAVIPVQSNLRFSACSYVYTTGVNDGKCAEVRAPTCGPIPYSIPKDHLYGTYCSNSFSVQSCSTYANGTGVPNADFVLYVFAVNTSKYNTVFDICN